MLNFFQVLILALFAWLAQTDASSYDFTFSSPLFAGFFTGVIIGDIPLGIAVGGTLQLMSLGLATYGGTSVPDYLSGAIIGTALTSQAMKLAQAPMEEQVAMALSLAIPVGLLLIQMDILRRTLNVFWQHMAIKAAADRKYNRIVGATYLGMCTTGLSRALPVFVALQFGEPVVKLMTENMPVWLMNGLKTAGGLLPAMGMAILLRYLPLKKFYPFFILGFVLFAYAGSLFSTVAIALIGFVAAAVFIMLKKGGGDAVVAEGTDDVEVEIDE